MNINKGDKCPKCGRNALFVVGVFTEEDDDTGMKKIRNCFNCSHIKIDKRSMMDKNESEDLKEQTNGI
jgi:hypothetical protein